MGDFHFEWSNITWCDYFYLGVTSGYFVTHRVQVKLDGNVGPLKSIIMHMYPVLCLGPFCMKNCISAAWHGCCQPVALLRCYRRPGCFNSGLQFFYIVQSHVFHLTLGIAPWTLHGVQVRWVCWPIKHSNTMVIEPAFGSYGIVGSLPSLYIL